MPKQIRKNLSSNQFLMHFGGQLLQWQQSGKSFPHPLSLFQSQILSSNVQMWCELMNINVHTTAMETWDPWVFGEKLSDPFVQLLVYLRLHFLSLSSCPISTIFITEKRVRGHGCNLPYICFSFLPCLASPSYLVLFLLLTLSCFPSFRSRRSRVYELQSHTRMSFSSPCNLWTSPSVDPVQNV